MDFTQVSLPALFLLGATSLVLLLFYDWRILIFTLGLQYVGVFVLVGLTWPLEMAVIKLVVGWISAAVLGMELVGFTPEETYLSNVIRPASMISTWLFRFFLAFLIGLAIFSLVPEMAKWLLNASYSQLLGSTLLIGMGILQLGLTERPFQVTIGILTFLSGFEVLYAAVETSGLVAGFLAFLSLGIALVGSYLVGAPEVEVDS
jgi:hypothetical protein